MMRSVNFRRFLPVVGLVLFALTLVTIREELKVHSYAEIIAVVRSIGGTSVAAAFGLTLLSFFILSGYDLLAVRSVGSKLAYHRIAFASFLGYAFSQALGFSLVTGIPIRYRLLSSWGMTPGEIARVVAFYSFSFWLGLAAVGGMALLWEPAAMAQAMHLVPFLPHIVGGFLLATVLVYLVWAAQGRAPLRIGSFELRILGTRQSLAQLALGAADWFVAALVLYVLIPGDHGLSLPFFVGAFVLAQTVGIISPIPGGLGVFEAVILLILPASVPSSLAIGAMVAYRAVYYLAPLVLAMTVLGIYEALLRWKAVGRATQALRTGATSLVPLLLSVSIFAAGGSLLLTGAIPIPPARMSWLTEAFPLPLIEASHFLGSVVGAGLLILAWGVGRRLDGAYHLTAVLLGAGSLLSAGRAGGLVHAGSLLALLLVLWAARGEFFRKASLTSEPFTGPWAAALAAALLATGWLGLFAFKEVHYSNEMWWQFALNEEAPRFLRATVGGLAVVALFALQRLLRPARPDEETPPGVFPPEVTPLVLASPRTQPRMAFLGDKSFLLSDKRNALLMYAVKGRSWIVLSDPVGDPDEFPELIWHFRNRVHRHGGWPVFFQVTPPFLPLYLDAGLALLKVGEEGKVPLTSFTLEGSHRSGLRQTVRRMEREGGTFEVVPREAVGVLLPELRAISDSWLEEKATREKSFSLGSFSEEYMLLTPAALVRVNGKVVAFANVLEGGGKNEVAPDLMRHLEEAPNGTMEYLFIKMMLWGAEEGFQWLTLGTAPLSGLGTGPMANIWSRVGAAVYRHGEHFYNFQGLRAYKEKFDPIWEPRYLASPGGAALPFIVTNLTSLISGGIVGALGK